MESELEKHDLLRNWRVALYVVLAVLLPLAFTPIVWMVRPTSRVDCANACQGKMRSYTDAIPGHWVPVQIEDTFLGKKYLDDQRKVWVDATAEKCECQ